MNSKSILQSDVLDIIFEKRNKLYGAYTLRKFYNNRLIKSIGTTLSVATILCAITLIPKEKKIVFTYQDVVMGVIRKVVAVEPKKELPKHAIKAATAFQRKFMVPVIADTNKADSFQTIKLTDIIGAVNIVGKENGKEIIGLPTEGNEGGGVVAQATVESAIDINQPMNNPDIEPAYPGGINALRKFLERNLTNPTAMEQGEMVAVNVRFVVGYDGKLQEFTIVKDGGNLYNNEVIRVMKKMPQWIPGKAKGQNVAVYFTIPVKFVPAD